MLAYPNISPVALSLGPVQVHWYGLMYLFAFLAGWGLARWRASRPAWIAAGWNGQKVDDLLTWIMLGVVAGGRSGMCCFTICPCTSISRPRFSRSGTAVCRFTAASSAYC